MRAAFDNQTGFLSLVFFGSFGGETWSSATSGQFQADRLGQGRAVQSRKWQMVHPDYLVAPEQARRDPGDRGHLSRDGGPAAPHGGPQAFALEALERAPEPPEWQERRLGGPGTASRPWREALARLHAPETEADLSPASAPWMRLAYDEVLADQLALALVRPSYRGRRGRPIAGDRRGRERIADALPFALTGSQTRALDEIAETSRPRSACAGCCRATSAPARPWSRRWPWRWPREGGAPGRADGADRTARRASTPRPSARWPRPPALRLGLLTGRDKGRRAREMLERLAAGDIDVADRHARALPGRRRLPRPRPWRSSTSSTASACTARWPLQAKGGTGGANLLVMTATPIPRTLR